MNAFCLTRRASEARKKAPPSSAGDQERRGAIEGPVWRRAPPKGAPNVPLIMTDDAGHGVPSKFGGVLPTPALVRVAKAGLRYTNSWSNR